MKDIPIRLWVFFVLVGFWCLRGGEVFGVFFGGGGVWFFKCVLHMYLPITGALNVKCQPFLHFLPQISAIQRTSNCLHS